jgi:hypothetical protein
MIFGDDSHLEPSSIVYVGKYYRHYKGSIYKVVDIAIYTETKETLVLYQQYIDSPLWARSISNFCGLVPIENCLRFTLVDSEHG